MTQPSENHVGAYTVNHIPVVTGEGTATLNRTEYVVTNWKGEKLFRSFNHTESTLIATLFMRQFNAGWEACGEKMKEVWKEAGVKL